MPRLFPLTLLSGTAITVTVFAFLELLPPVPNPASAQIGATAPVGRVEYASTSARTLDPRNRIDAALLKGASAARDRRRIWFGAFVVATNDGARPAAMARRVVLRDVMGRSYRPVRLPSGNRYAYRPRTLAPGAQAPAPTSPDEANLAAGGELLAFRIPRAAYEEGPLELQLGNAGANLKVSDGGAAHLISGTQG